MRISCNGCRVLRKACGENCTIRPCLHWIDSSDSQSNATLFLAKFYGRAGLLNLIGSGPDHLRPAIFRSLLYEACGRIVNPIYGSVGLLWSGRWHLCQAAVEAVLNGAPLAPIDSEAAVDSTGLPLEACDIRHVSDSTASVSRRRRFKRSSEAAVANPKAGFGSGSDSELVTGHESSSEAPNLEGDSKGAESESVLSTETAAELELSNQTQKRVSGEVELELTLGFGTVSSSSRVVPVKKRRFNYEEFGSDL